MTIDDWRYPDEKVMRQGALWYKWHTWLYTQINFNDLTTLVTLVMLVLDTGYSHMVPLGGIFLVSRYN